MFLSVVGVALVRQALHLRTHTSFQNVITRVEEDTILYIDDSHYQTQTFQVDTHPHKTPPGILYKGCSNGGMLTDFMSSKLNLIDTGRTQPQTQTATTFGEIVLQMKPRCRLESKTWPALIIYVPMFVRIMAINKTMFQDCGSTC